MQVHLYLSMILEDKMREAGIDPDKASEPVKTLETPADMAAFFGM